MAGRSVQLTGDWSRLQQVLKQAGPNLAKESRRTIGRQLKKIEAKVLGHVDQQDLEWPELSEAYAKTKERKGLSPDILRASNQMYSNITTAQSDDYTGMVGVRRGVKTKQGNDVTDIALIHEQPKDDGTKIPPRKLWKPTFEEMKPGIERELKGIAIEVFKK
ncbi:hypothetical protein [Geobacter sp. SVR]|uniref:hypothetical protein n=1 Tax=Geobacter sp. SVR TaxID=2495594 RepID=UPI00143F0560|nr:hypothetical protein [Geobacter sp. SVR]BCS55193.1 hypothetical protein GSVR_35010 [Geobacter sp. SVR]GCF85994.1 hypothetical protein GSbR_25940 [Geobacter sp. SVR]